MSAMLGAGGLKDNEQFSAVKGKGGRWSQASRDGLALKVGLRAVTLS